MNRSVTDNQVEVTLSLPVDLLAQADRLVESGVMPDRAAVLAAALEAYLPDREAGPDAPTPPPRQVAEARAGYLTGGLEARGQIQFNEAWTAEDEARLQAEAAIIWAEMEADWEAQPEYVRNGWPEELTPEMIAERVRALEESYCIVKLNNPELAYDIVTNPMLHEWNLDWELYGLQP